MIHHPLLSAEATVTHQYVFFVKRRFSTVSEVISIHINLTVVLKISKCQSLDIFLGVWCSEPEFEKHVDAACSSLNTRGTVQYYVMVGIHCLIPVVRDLREGLLTLG